MPTIFKGFHRPLLPALGLFYNRRHFNRKVTFTESCRYRIGADQCDINKLFGVGHFPHHHQESARFGWSYSEVTDRFYLYGYCYINGERREYLLCDVKIGKTVRCHLYAGKTTYFLWVVDDATGNTIGEYHIDRGSKKKWGYPLGLYFGGNRRCPHTMKIKIEKL